MTLVTGVAYIAYNYWFVRHRFVSEHKRMNIKELVFVFVFLDQVIFYGISKHLRTHFVFVLVLVDEQAITIFKDP